MKELWASLTPWTKRIIVICVATTLITLIIAAAYTGDLGELIRIITDGQKD